MIVYVVTREDYEDYEIVGVATEREQADAIQKYYEDGRDEVRVEVYDTTYHSFKRTNDNVLVAITRRDYAMVKNAYESLLVDGKISQEDYEMALRQLSTMLGLQE